MFHLPIGTSPSAPSVQWTLDHPDSFAAFRQWLSSRSDVLEFWLAIWAFRRAVREFDPRTQRIGIAFHRRFVSPRTGSCDFLPASLRSNCSERLQRRELMREDFFDACIAHTWTHLVREHAQFVWRTKAEGIKRTEVADAEDGRSGGTEEGAESAFARELAEKLGKLAVEERKRKIEAGERKADEEAEGETMTPERMCAWMQFASRNSGDALTFPALDRQQTAQEDQQKLADYAESSVDTSTIGAGYISYSSRVLPTVRHSDSSGFCSSTNSKSFALAPSSSASPSSSPFAPSNSITISYREANGGPPFVVRIEPRETVTFREFRRFFGISSRNNKRFLFKEHCHEAPNAFQWAAIYNDASALPVFGGQIVAECRTLSESE